VLFTFPDNVGPDQRGICFTLQDGNPTYGRVPKHAPNISQTHALAIALHSIAEVDKKEGCCEVNLEWESHAAHIIVMTPSMLSIRDSMALKVWEVEPDLRYRLKIAVPGHLKHHVSTVLCDLVCAQKDTDVTDSGLTLLPGDDTGGHKLKVLEFMRAHGFTTCIYEELQYTMSTWALTHAGTAQIRLANVLSRGRYVTEPRAHVKLEDLTIIEMHTRLAAKGWRCRVWSHEYADSIRKASRSRVASDRVLARPIDYVPGGPLVWWMRPTATTFNRPYFLALLTVDVHKRPVPPFKTAAFYTALLEGNAYVPRARQDAFRFGATEYEVPPAAKRARRERQRAPHINRDCDLDYESVGDSDSDSGSGSSGGDGPSLSPSGSSSTSSSTDSATSSSSSDSVQQSRRGGSTVLLPTTTYWHGCRFTQVKVMDKHVGWEAICNCDEHHGKTTMCRITRKFKKRNNPEVVERKLKWWLVSAGAAARRSEHKRAKFPADDMLPSMAELEQLAQAVLN
jgi:hypothetical protein